MTNHDNLTAILIEMETDGLFQQIENKEDVSETPITKTGLKKSQILFLIALLTSLAFFLYLILQKKSCIINTSQITESFE